MMTTVITPANLPDLFRVSDVIADSFDQSMWGFCGDCIVLSYDEEQKSNLYNVWSKLDFVEFSLGMEGIELNFENGPAVLAGMLEAYEMENIMHLA